MLIGIIFCIHKGGRWLALWTAWLTIATTRPYYYPRGHRSGVVLVVYFVNTCIGSSGSIRIRTQLGLYIVNLGKQSGDTVVDDGTWYSRVTSSWSRRAYSIKLQLAMRPPG